MTIAERLTPAVWLRVAGREWRVLITYGALLDCEHASGVSMLSAAGEILRPSGRLLRGLLWAVLRRAGSEITVDQVGGLLTRVNLIAVHGVLLRGWIVSMPDAPKKAPIIEKKVLVKSWDEAWAIATARDGLALSDEQWLALTPRLVHALSEERLEAIRQEEYRSATIAAAVANWGPHAPKPALKEAHFMRHAWPEDEKPQHARSAGDEFMEWMKAWKKWNPTK